jgi:hypothetical protein
MIKNLRKLKLKKKLIELNQFIYNIKFYHDIKTNIPKMVSSTKTKSNNIKLKIINRV